MSTTNPLIPCALLALTAGLIGACSDETSGLHLQDAYIKRPIPGRSMTAAYATFINDTPDTLCLVGFETDVANAVELHVTEPVGGANSQRVAMRHIDEQCIAPNEHLQLQPGGKHLMVMGLTDQELPESVTIKLGTSTGRLFAREFAVVPFNYSPENL